MSSVCLNIESQLEMGTSISVEWCGVGKKEMCEREQRTMELGVKTMSKGEAGWIAC
jgi:hypothetical protein